MKEMRRRHGRNRRSDSYSRNWSLNKARRRYLQLRRWVEHYTTRDGIIVPSQFYRAFNALADADYRAEVHRVARRFHEPEVWINGHPMVCGTCSRASETWVLALTCEIASAKLGCLTLVRGGCSSMV